MRYTYAMVSWKAVSPQDRYGDTEYQPVQMIRARKQPLHEIVQDSEGKSYLSKSIYYVDPAVEPKAFLIGEMDKLDDELILKSYQMCDLFNKVKLIRFVTI